MKMMSTSTFQASLLTFVVILAGCATQNPGTDPDDMSVEEHKQTAEEHEERAEKHEEQYDPEAVEARTETARETTGYETYSTETYNPTAEHLKEAKKHERHAEQHLEAAQTLETFEEKQCSRFPQDVRPTCPLMGRVIDTENVEDGVLVTFNEEVALEPTVDHIKCHFAFARTQGYEGMDSCPLYLKGISVEAKPGSNAVLLKTDNPDSVEPLRQRARDHVSPEANQ